MDEIKKIGETEIHKGIRVHLFKEQIQLPDGKVVEWDLIKHVGAAAVIPIMDDGKIIMVRQYRNASDSYTLEIPAGTLDSKTEDPKDCAFRELEEETGYRTEALTYLYKFYSAIGFTDEIISIYVAKNLIKSEQNLDEDEYVDLEYYTLDQLVEMIFTGEIIDNKTISAILMYKTSLERS